MKVVVGKKESDSKRKHNGSTPDDLLLKRKATLHPAPQDLHFLTLEPDLLRNVYKDFYLMEVTPEKQFRIFDVSKNPANYEFPKSMNAQYYYRLKVRPGKPRSARYHYQLCNEAIVRRLMFNDFWSLFVKNVIPPVVEDGKPFAHKRCNGILVKSHVPYRFHHEECFQCLCRQVVDHYATTNDRDDKKDSEFNQAIKEGNSK
jgi:hypothetical protein